MCFGLGREGLREGEWNCLKHYKRGWNRKEWKRSKDLKKEGTHWSRDGCLKKGGGESGPPYERFEGV